MERVTKQMKHRTPTLLGRKTSSLSRGMRDRIRKLRDDKRCNEEAEESFRSCAFLDTVDEEEATSEVSSESFHSANDERYLSITSPNWRRRNRLPFSQRCNMKCIKWGEGLLTCMSPAWSEHFVRAPLISIVLNVVVATVLSLFVTSPDNTDLLTKAGTMLDLLSMASITVAALSFSLTVLSVQVASQNYSPRLLDDFLRNPVPTWVISLNVGAYAYCYTMAYFIVPPKDDAPDDDDAPPYDDDFERQEVPFLSIHLLSVQMAAVLVSFVYFIYCSFDNFRIETLLDRVHQSLGETKSVFESLQHQNKWVTATGTALRIPRLEGKDEFLPFQLSQNKTGYVTGYNMKNLVDFAVSHNAYIKVLCRIGDSVDSSTVLCNLWIQAGQEIEIKTLEAFNDKIVKNIEVSGKRSPKYDFALGMQELTDVAVRALSPAVNDPETAKQTMDCIARVIKELEDPTIPLGIPNAYDSKRIMRVSVPRLSFTDILSILDPIRFYGKDDIAVCRRGIRLLSEIAMVHASKRSPQVFVFKTIFDRMNEWMKSATKAFEHDNTALLSLAQVHYDAVKDVVLQMDQWHTHESEASQWVDKYFRICDAERVAKEAAVDLNLSAA